jgi:hypothetical protein
MIRKKYGVRLRERRTKAEIQAERERMGMKANSNSTNTTASTSQNLGKRAADSSAPGGVGAGGVGPGGVGAGGVGVAGGWTTANTPPSHEHGREDKRRRIDSNGSREPSPTMHPPAVSKSPPGRKDTSVPEMGGGGLVRAVAHEDPALPPPSAPDRRSPSASRPAETSQQSPTRSDIHMPPPPGVASTDDRVAPQSSVTGPGSLNKPLGPGVNSGSSDDDGDDEGIPATLPAPVRQSLNPL